MEVGAEVKGRSYRREQDSQVLSLSRNATLIERGPELDKCLINLCATPLTNQFRFQIHMYNFKLHVCRSS